MKLKYLGLIFIIFSLDNYGQDFTDEIIFHSEGSTFSPLITLQGDAEILWVFDDSTTSSEMRPTKNYGTAGTRVNRLKITPWSAVRGINLGYDGSDGGSTLIPYVSNQFVSRVENLHLVAPYLELWCSSYNPLDSLNFDNFINLDTLESFKSTLQKISLKNTPNLKRLCLEDNHIGGILDISECTGLEDLRGALNNYEDVIFSNSTEELWHICIRDNPQITNPYLFANMERFPNISELFIWNCNQSGSFEMHHTNADSISIIAYDNHYATVDFSGSFQNENGWASILFKNNSISVINLQGCVQIKILNLHNNKVTFLDIADCLKVEYLMAGYNDCTDFIFPDTITHLKEIVIGNNTKIINPTLFSNMEKFPEISKLYASNCNQMGELKIPKTTADTIQIAARSNNYATIDFSGAFQRENGWAYVDLYGNQINSVNLEGCAQIKYLNLQNNKLSSDSVDKILQQLDELGTSNGHVDLRSNKFPTSAGYAYARNLESRGWIVYVSNQSVIEVFGNNNEITDGDTIPSRLNLTDFDSLNVENGSTIHSFVIKNAGSSDLRLIGANFLYDAPYVSVIGVNLSDFTIISEPDPVIVPGDSTVFQVSFDPAEEGLRTAVISIPNSNWVRSPFDFRIQGTGVVVSSAEKDQNDIPGNFGLSQNYPNPFNPSTIISYQLPEASFITLKIYDILGNEITTLLNEEKAAGSYEVQFKGQQLASGIYYYKMQAGDFVEVRKMILMK